MPMQILPKTLTTTENLQRLIRLLLEKETLRRSLQPGDFGPRVTEAEEAQSLLDRVIQVSRRTIALDDYLQTIPSLRLTRRLSRLPRQIVLLYLLLSPAGLFFLYLTLKESEASGALWIARGAIFTLFVVPLLFYRRARINIEHECGYVRDSKGRSVIVIDQLRTVQFQSYLAHEYGHHLYLERWEPGNEEWVREGWARLVQWQVVQQLCREEENQAYLYHALVQIIGELKFACEIISRTLHQRVPFRVSLLRTIYQRNPLMRQLTGTPGFSTSRLIDHAVGTAFYFLEADRLGPQEALRQSFQKE
ncbi:MAG: hypothetical protein PVH35_09595 [Syntrophobacterales bacterium]